MVPDFQQVALATHSRNCWMLSSLGNVTTALGVRKGTSSTLWEIWRFFVFCFFFIPEALENGPEDPSMPGCYKWWIFTSRWVSVLF